ncbi:MAG: phenylalanine--tRNA ligase subunit alpha [Patescibacteria group bacterium]|nr:phenylalanine--tRNA ligase subunit alpha [Patescibacteria group bacterium]
MQEKLLKLKQEILNQLESIKQADVLRDLEIKYLGRKGELTKILRSVADLSVEEKKTLGKLANEIKIELVDKFAEAKAGLEKTAGADYVDATLPGVEIKAGHLHPITIIQNEIEDLFASLGFMALDGPELESDYYNFTALNIPPYHPARDMQDTFYINPSSAKASEGKHELLMRTQTSPMQIRAMQKYGAPIKCIVPGRCFRSEATDVRHEHTFYQVEGLMVDENINFSHLKAILEVLGKKLFGPETVFRMRPKFYPFVEPGSNGEYSCFLCGGKGCRLCKGTGWLEIVGCGMVHPSVLKAGGVDPKKYQGFAFGYGLDRLAMLKYGINDIRLFHSGDLKFLKQF